MHDSANLPYYIRAFQWALQEAISHTKYTSLLSQEELDLIGKFFTLTVESQRFYVRLWLRRNKQSFSSLSLIENYRQEFLSVDSLMEECQVKDFLQEVTDQAEIIQYSLTKQQLETLYESIFYSKCTFLTKSAIIEKLMSQEAKLNSFTTKPVLKQTKLFILPSNQIGFKENGKVSIQKCITEKFGRFFSLRFQTDFYQICTLVLLPTIDFHTLNSSNLLDSVIMTELGQLKYPNFKINTTVGIFTTRSIFNEYLLLREALIFLTDLPEECTEIAPILFSEYYERFLLLINEPKESTCFDRFSIDYVLVKIVLLYSSFLESQGQYKKANKIYFQILNSHNQIIQNIKDRERCWERLLINTDCKLRDSSLHRSLLEVAVTDELLPEYFIHSLFDKLTMETSLSYLPTVALTLSDDYVPAESVGKRVLLRNEFGAKFNVENFVIDKYEIDGWFAIHSEGILLSTVSVLLCWELIFDSSHSDLQFQSKYQSLPLDFYSRTFWTLRQVSFQNYFKSLMKEPSLIVKNVQQAYTNYSGTCCPAIKWSIHVDVCVAFCQAIPSNALLELVELLMKDFSRHSAGFPDLFLWKQSGDSLQCKIIEVKSHNDTLSIKQQWWIRQLLRLKIDVEIVKIKKSR